MRIINTNAISNAIARLCIEANILLPADVRAALCKARENEDTPVARSILDTLVRNADIAREDRLPICQDTGMAVVFAEIGQEVYISGGLFADAVNEGVRRGYTDGYLRASVVADPIHRNNTLDNTPAVIYTELVPGDKLTLTVAPKGFGSENMSKIALLKPSDGIVGVENFIVETVRSAGSNPCPPMIIGVGAGGTMDKAALLAKRSLLREIGSENLVPFWNEREKQILSKVNTLNIGAGGLGGKATALAVHIEVFAAHIASLPVAVNISCHATRHAKTVL